MPALRSLFSASSSSARISPQQKNPTLRREDRSGAPRVDLPTMTGMTFSGLKSLLYRDLFEDREMADHDRSWDGPGIRITESFDASISRHSQVMQQVNIILNDSNARINYFNRMSTTEISIPMRCRSMESSIIGSRYHFAFLYSFKCYDRQYIDLFV